MFCRRFRCQSYSRAATPIFQPAFSRQPLPAALLIDLAEPYELTTFSAKIFSSCHIFDTTFASLPTYAFFIDDAFSLHWRLYYAFIDTFFHWLNIFSIDEIIAIIEFSLSVTDINGYFLLLFSIAISHWLNITLVLMILRQDFAFFAATIRH